MSFETLKRLASRPFVRWPAALLPEPGALPAAAAGACFARPALGWRLPAVEHVVVVIQRVRQVVELASLVVGEALGPTGAGVREDGHAAEAEPGAGRLSGARHGRRWRIAALPMAVLGRPVRVAVVAAEEALHPLLLGAPRGRAPGPLVLGELEGVEAAPDRLAVDLVLGGEVGQARAGAKAAPDLLDLLVREFGPTWHRE